MMKQKEAVYAAYQAGTADGLEHGSKELFNHVASAVATGITNGEVVYEKNRADEKAVQKYGRDVTSNWFKKDIRIAGAKYVPATKRGPMVKDQQLKDLKESLASLKAHNQSMTLIQQVEAKIAERQALLAAEKGKAKVKPLEETLASLQNLGIEV